MSAKHETWLRSPPSPSVRTWGKTPAGVRAATRREARARRRAVAPVPSCSTRAESAQATSTVACGAATASSSTSRRTAASRPSTPRRAAAQRVSAASPRFVIEPTPPRRSRATAAGDAPARTRAASPASSSASPMRDIAVYRGLRPSGTTPGPTRRRRKTKRFSAGTYIRSSPRQAMARSRSTKPRRAGAGQDGRGGLTTGLFRGIFLEEAVRGQEPGEGELALAPQAGHGREHDLQIQQEREVADIEDVIV